MYLKCLCHSFMPRRLVWASSGMFQYSNYTNGDPTLHALIFSYTLTVSSTWTRTAMKQTSLLRCTMSTSRSSRGCSRKRSSRLGARQVVEHHQFASLQSLSHIVVYAHAHTHTMSFSEKCYDESNSSGAAAMSR